MDKSLVLYQKKYGIPLAENLKNLLFACLSISATVAYLKNFRMV